MLLHRFLVISLPLALAPSVWAEESLLIPRPLNPEPHPYTTEPGTFQLEISPLSFAYDRHNPERTRTRAQSFDIPVLFKVGVLENMDVQFGMDFVLWDRVRDEGESTTDEGFSDLTIRVKYNLWGNDGEGDSALALMPFIVLPIGSDEFGLRGIRGGMMVPTEWALSESWTLNVTPSLAAVRDSEDDDLELEIANILTVTRGVTDQLDLWVEFESSITTESGDRWAGTVLVGGSQLLDANTVLDLAVGFGVTRSADDFSIALTLVRRF
ncbi:MAG: transporter [Phycisphaerales bacterium]